MARVRSSLALALGSVLTLACGPGAELTGRLLVATPRPDAGTTTSTPTPDAGFGPRDGGPGTEHCPEPTLTSIREKVFVPTCAVASCHVAPMPKEELDLSLPVAELSARLRERSRESASGLQLVAPGAVGASWLYLKVFFETPTTGDSMPPDLRLDDCQLDGIRDWINAGAPDE